MEQYLAPTVFVVISILFVGLIYLFIKKMNKDKQLLHSSSEDKPKQEVIEEKSAQKKKKKIKNEKSKGNIPEEPSGAVKDDLDDLKTEPIDMESEIQKASEELEKIETSEEKLKETAKVEEISEEKEAEIIKKPTPKTLKEGLKKTRGGLISRLGKLLSFKKEIDEEILDELEVLLFTADIGPVTAEKLFESVKEQLSRKELKKQDVVWDTLKDESLKILDIPSEDFKLNDHKPFVIIVIGVNGVGKTTTIGKLASMFKEQGKSVLLAAGDTFRAAATEQLEVWAQERVGCDIVKGKEGSDPSSVIFDAIKQAEKNGNDIVIADTAGRLHTQTNLMDELQKVKRVCNKALEGAPHETFLVLDATNGQNALHQADSFMKVMDFSGIIITKMDGTAKGGVILGICDKMGVPVRYIGIGEQVEDLRSFKAKEFVDALFEHENL